MAKVKCERCGKKFVLDDDVDRFDEEYGVGSYNYLYLANTFCYECAVDLYEENEDSLYFGSDAQDIYDSSGRDEDYDFR